MNGREYREFSKWKRGVHGLPEPIVRTAEYVSPMHPDKICDRIADAVLDAYTAKDPKARVAVEVMGGHGLVTLNGEVTSRSKVDVSRIVQKFLRSVGYKNMKVLVNLAQQSPEIARGVDTGGAGDQGVMVGYACDETPDFYPLEYALARDLCMRTFKRWSNDGKTQVTIENGKPTVVVASFQSAPKAQLEPFVRRAIKADTYLINPAGDWTLGGFDADSGLSGRKLVVDAYGPRVPIGGGSWAGKDMTKVDRSGAIAARRIAVDRQRMTKHKPHTKARRLAQAEFLRTFKISIFEFPYYMRLRANYRDFAFIEGINSTETAQYFQRYYDFTHAFDGAISGLRSTLEKARTT